MSNKIYKSIAMFILSLSLVTFFTGCTTLADARNAEGTGVKQTYSKDYDQVWKASISSLNSLGLAIASENKSDGYILAQRGMTAFSYGENIAVFVKRRGDKQVSVEVVSKKAMTTNVFAPDWTGDIFNRISSQLN